MTFRNLRFIALSFSLALSALGFAQRAEDTEKPTLRLEEAMRTWQERWLIVSGADQPVGMSNPNRVRAGATTDPATGYSIFSGPVSWPARALDGKRPSPFPEDCFYKEDFKKANLVASRIIGFRSSILACLGAAIAAGPGDLGGVILRFDPNWDKPGVPYGSGGPLTAGQAANRMFKVYYNGSWVYPDPNVAPWSTIIGGSITIDNFESRFGDLVGFLKLPMRLNTYLTQVGNTSGLAWNWKNNFISPDIFTTYCNECQTCETGGACTPGKTTARNGSVDLTIALGGGADGSIGAIKLYAETPSAALCSPAALSVGLKGRIYNTATASNQSPDQSEAGVILDETNSPRQIVLPQGLIDIVVDTGSPAYGYTLRFYDLAHRGVLSGAFYAPTPADAYRTVHIENPDGAAASNRLRVTEANGVATSLMLYAYDSAAGAWSLTTGFGAEARTEKSTRQWTTGTGVAVGDILTETKEIRDSADRLVLKTRKRFKIFHWNTNSAGVPLVTRGRRYELTEETVDPDGKNLTTTYRYDETVGGSYLANQFIKRLKQIARPDGSWERYDYDSTSGKTLKTYRSFNDSSAPASLTGVPTGDYRVTEISAAASPETITEIIRTGGVDYPVSRRFITRDFAATNTYDIVTEEIATSAAAVAGSAANLKTITRTWSKGLFQGRPERGIQPDGTISRYSYTRDATTNQTTTTVRQGVPNNADPLLATDVTDGITTVTVTNAQGQPISEVVTDAASGIQLSNTVYADFDSFGRWRLATYIDGTTSTRTYDCCGLESETDRSGLRTVYGHDSLKRVNRQTVYLGAALTAFADTEFTFDAAGHTLQTIRHACGTSLDATVPTTITASDNLYNVAGQLTSSASPRGTTLIDESITAAGKRQVTTTYTDLATRIEFFDRAGQLESISGTAAEPMKYVQGVDATGAFTQEIKLGDGAPAAETEWVKSYRDFAGRPADTVFADGAKIIREYFAANDSSAGRRGKLKAETRPADSDAVGAIGVRTLFDYNSRGEQEVTAVDLNQDGVIDYTGTDRIAKTVSDVASVTHDSVAYAVQRTTTSVWAADNTDTASAVNVSETTPGGLYSWQTVHGLTTGSVTTLSGNGARTVVTTSPDTTIATQSFIGDRLQFSKAESGVTQLGRTDVQYDGYGRAERMTDARNGATTFTYYNDGLQKTVLSPDPDTTRSGPGYDAQTTQFFHDSMGRPTRTILPDAAETYASYWPTGAPKRTWGARTTAQEMTYDSQGRLKTSATWSSFVDETSFDSTVGKAVTTWNYSPTRGWLDNKRYADNRGPTFTHFPSGAVKLRTWARTVGGAALTTTYALNTAGELSSVDYSDATPDVTEILYDRLGRQTSVTDAAGTRTASFEMLTALLDDETYAAGTGALAGLSVSRTRDTHLRPDGLTVPSVSSVGYSYRDGSQLNTVSATIDGTTTDHTYTYQTNSRLIDQLVQKRSATTVLTTTKTFDKLNRLAGVSAAPSVAAVVSSAYLYNSANQRTRLTETDGKFWDFGHDPLGQVTAGTKKLPNGTPVLGHSFGYGFDTIGNRSTTTVNGQSATYTPTTNGLNQYDNRTVPAALDVLGTADAGAKVAVNLTEAQRQGDLFYKQLPVANTSAAKWQPIDVLAGKAEAGTGGADADTRQSGHLFLAQTPENFAYDFDGNLIAGAQWSYSYDAENRLVSMETQPAAATAGVPKQRLEFAYDSNGRRIQKKVSDWSGSAYVLASDTRFLYDGWNLIVEFSVQGSVFSVQRSYVWGLDLSGSSQGAGGVGGLLAVKSSAATYLPTFDGNGNVIALADAASGTSVAQYEYGPFGEPLRATGPAAAANPFRFSTKYTDTETGLVYYGLRYYDPSTGRWLSRDPIEEEGGANLYGMTGNNPINAVDLFGQKVILGLLYYDESASFFSNYTNWSLQSASIPFSGDYWKSVVRNTTTFGKGLAIGVFHDVPVGAWEMAKLGVKLQDPRLQADIAAVAARFAQDPCYRQRVRDLLKKQYGIIIDDLSTQEGFMLALGRLGGQIIGTKGLGEIMGALKGLQAAESAGTQTLYRTMSVEHYNQLLNTGKLPATSETFLSPSLQYARQYNGVTVGFTLRGGTTESLMNIGVRNAGLTGEAFQGLPLVQRGWTSSNAFFKLEGDVINIGLGRGTALETFNSNILTFGAK